MAKNDYLSLRVNKELKETFYEFCRLKGFTAGKAMKLFARQFSKDDVIPFPLDVNRTYKDENFVRVSIHMDYDTRMEFFAACDKYGLPMSIIVRGFMDYCVTHDSFPYTL
ncbi:hypothetical protein OBV_p-00070 (plasmid) [Oscillibacter valericigenes Sjm18-20]|nr:hypothetical protein OBV_p-00070 [Oscillibacter valericigenes Sjm18-20]